MRFLEKYSEHYNEIYKDKPYKLEADFAYTWAQEPKTIVELGCGTGNHCRYWADKAKITAIDGSKYMLRHAFQHKNITYKCLPINAETLSKIQPADCVMSLFNVMGYVLLEDCISYLPIKKGGYFIFDVWAAAKFLRQPPQVKVKYFSDDKFRIAVPTRETERMIKIHFFIGSDKGIESFETHYVEGYFKNDIKQFCKKTGFKLIASMPTNTWTVWYKLQKI